MAKVKVKQSISNKPKYFGILILFTGVIVILIMIINTAFENKGKVRNSPWDSSVHQVERYLKRNLKDPNSFEALSWSKVYDKNNNNSGYRYKVRVKYKAKNSFGGYVIENDIFFLDEKGNVVRVE